LREWKETGAGDMAQVVEHLSSKGEVMSSNPRITKRKGGEGEKKEAGG
jgi:hypothetical protein